MKTLILIAAFAIGGTAWAEQPNPRKIYEEGVKLMERGDAGGARARFAEAVKLDAGFDEARFQLAVAYHFAGKNSEALRELERIQSPDVKRMTPLLQGEIYLKMKKWADAEKVWEKFPDDNPDLQAIKAQGMARSYEGQGKNREAADAWTRYLELQVKPTNDVFQKMAENRVKAGLKDDALKYCGETKLLAKHESYQLLCRAHVYHAARDKKKAVETLRDALTKDKDNHDAATLLRQWN